MSRGRSPEKALEIADKIAKKRGHVQQYERGPAMISDFSITKPECHVPVRIKRLRCIRQTPQWIEHAACDEIADLKMYPSSQEISRELWIYSPDYFWRFFRVCDTGLIELGRNGEPLPQKTPGPK